MWPRCRAGRIRRRGLLVSGGLLVACVYLVVDWDRRWRRSPPSALQPACQPSWLCHRLEGSGEKAINGIKPDQHIAHRHDNKNREEPSPQPGGVPASSPAKSGAGPGSHVVLYWTSVFGRADFELGLGDAPFRGCPVSNCYSTKDRSQLSRASAVLLHGRTMRLTDLPRRHSLQQLFVLTLGEAPPNFWPYYEPGAASVLDGFFNLTMTYRQDADIYYPERVVKPGRQPGNMSNLHRRRRLAAWLVSHCFTASGREALFDDLSDFVKIDEYGSCNEEALPPPCGMVQWSTHADIERSIGQCYEALSRVYLFYLALENSLCDHYISEKFWYTLEAGMVPVVMGARRSDYERVAPPHSFIHVDDFSGVKELAEYLLYLRGNRTAYEEYFQWRETLRVSEPRVTCDLCARIQQPRVPQQVQLSQVWSTRSNCRPAYQSYTLKNRTSGGAEKHTSSESADIREVN